MLTRTINPFTALSELRREMDQIFDWYGPRFNGGSWTRPTTFPAVNVWEDGETLYAEAEIPGVNLDEIEVYAVGNELTIKGTRKPCECEDVSYHRRERGTGDFTRVVTLPVDVDADKIEACLKNGILTIKLPKAEEAKPKRITVKTD